MVSLELCPIIHKISHKKFEKLTFCPEKINDPELVFSDIFMEIVSVDYNANIQK